MELESETKSEFNLLYKFDEPSISESKRRREIIDVAIKHSKEILQKDFESTSRIWLIDDYIFEELIHKKYEYLKISFIYIYYTLYIKISNDFVWTFICYQECTRTFIVISDWGLILIPADDIILKYENSDCEELYINCDDVYRYKFPFNYWDIRFNVSTVIAVPLYSNSAGYFAVHDRNNLYLFSPTYKVVDCIKIDMEQLDEVKLGWTDDHLRCTYWMRNDDLTIRYYKIINDRLVQINGEFYGLDSYIDYFKIPNNHNNMYSVYTKYPMKKIAEVSPDATLFFGNKHSMVIDNTTREREKLFLYPQNID